MALKHLAHRDDVQIIYPVHLNPKVSIPVKELLGEINNIHLIDPLGYPESLLMNKAHIILTDSGGKKAIINISYVKKNTFDWLAEFKIDFLEEDTKAIQFKYPSFRK